MKEFILIGISVLSCLFLLPAPNIEGDPSTSKGSISTPLEISSIKKDLPTLNPLASFPEMVKGTVEYVSILKPEAWFNRPTSYSDLGEITSLTGKIQMVSFGGGLTAGVSNGGLNREGQQFAYPNLVAHQMGLDEFETPLFDQSEGNGIGTYIYADSTTSYPRWKEVSNNLATIQNGEKVKLTPYVGKVNNYAFPNGGTLGLDFSNPYLSRFLPLDRSAGIKGIDFIRAHQNYDLVIIEDFIDSWISSVLKEERLDYRHLNGAILNTGDVPLYGMRSVINKAQRGAIFTIPSYMDLACMNWYSVERLKGIVKSFTISYSNNGEKKTLDQTSLFQLKPTPAVDSMFRKAKQGKSISITLTDNDLLDKQEIWVADPDLMYNPKIKEFAEANKLALVDLRSVYERIHEGTYVTEDGYKIDGSMKGNFFSSDGIYPTPIGQAVIANEVIKALNAKYGSRIPLINVGEYAKLIGVK